MIASQYKIKLADDFDMSVIEERVKNNGYKTDGFEGLYAKFYLMARRGEHGAHHNLYCPLYLWKTERGLNRFLFEGFYDNILNSFGWQKVNIGIPLIQHVEGDLLRTQYVLEESFEIKEKASLNHFISDIEQDVLRMDFLNYILIYNPDKWQASVFYFLESLESLDLDQLKGVLYQVGHVSM